MGEKKSLKQRLKEKKEAKKEKKHGRPNPRKGRKLGEEMEEIKKKRAVKKDPTQTIGEIVDGPKITKAPNKMPVKAPAEDPLLAILKRVELKLNRIMQELSITMRPKKEPKPAKKAPIETGASPVENGESVAPAPPADAKST